MSAHKLTGTQHTYLANEHDTVLSEVFSVHCVVAPRALLVTGFNETGQLVMAHYNSYGSREPAWDASFFEHDFINEKLLGVPQQVNTIFVGSEEQLIIPKALYDEKAAKTWIRSLQPVCPDDVFHSCAIESAEALYSFALPARMDKLLHRYFGDTRILPLATYQFFKPNPGAQYLLQCLISSDTLIATLNSNGKLLWHRQLSYGNAEEIAWQAANLCREMGIPKIDLQVECTMLSKDTYELAQELERYFPKIKWSTGNVQATDPWSPVVYLAQQLYACAL